MDTQNANVDIRMINEKIEKESKKRRSANVLWSPDSKKFALTRRDNRHVKALWVINVTNQPRPDLETYKYQMPGEKEAPQSELWIFDMDKKKGKEIDADNPPHIGP